MCTLIRSHRLRAATEEVEQEEQLLGFGVPLPRLWRWSPVQAAAMGSSTQLLDAHSCGGNTKRATHQAWPCMGCEGAADLRSGWFFFSLACSLTRCYCLCSTQTWRGVAEGKEQQMRSLLKREVSWARVCRHLVGKYPVAALCVCLYVHVSGVSNVQPAR